MVMLLNRLKTHLDAHVNAATQPAAAGDAEQTNETHADGAPPQKHQATHMQLASPATNMSLQLSCIQYHAYA